MNDSEMPKRVKRWCNFIFGSVPGDRDNYNTLKGLTRAVTSKKHQDSCQLFNKFKAFPHLP
jgi:hypothetical protein